MSEEKKYSAREAAIAVLKKTEEVLKKTHIEHSLEKAVSMGKVGGARTTGEEKGVHEPTYGTAAESKKELGESFAGHLTRAGKGKNSTATVAHKKVLKELKAMPKPNLTKREGNPDSKQDEELGEEVAHDVVEHIAKDPASHKEELKELKVNKAEPESKDITGDQKVREQVDPELNPKENAEGNNQEWGTSPKSYGSLKLAKFLGHIEAKRKSKKETMEKGEGKHSSSHAYNYDDNTSVKGVHSVAPVYNQTQKRLEHGHSEAGLKVQRAHSGRGTEASANKAKEIHSEKLKELKEMPKPNLTKEEK
jgi:hypothetical protein